MKIFRHILFAGLFCWLLAACGSQGNPSRTNPVQPAVGDDGSEQVRDSSLTSHPVDETTVQENYIHADGDTAANIMNIVNLFLFREITRQELMDDLAVNNFAMTPDSLPQLFQVYQRNDSLQIPNFITVDLMAQLSHIYENYVLRTVEERFFAPMLTELCLALHGASVDQAGKAAREDIRDMAQFNAAFFAVAYNLLTGKSLKIQGEYQTFVELELAYIAQQEKRRPALLDKRADFDYSVFKPYGHYTRTAQLRRYFKAWKWLQLAPYCSDNKLQVQQAVLTGLAFQTAKTKSGASAFDVYANLSVAMDWFSGKSAYHSMLDVALLLKKERITTVAATLDAKFLAKVNAAILQTQPNAGKSSFVKYPAVCRNGVYFLPQPAYTNETADWDISSYNKRLECALAMQQNPRNSPVFARKPAWNRKKLDTSSALRVKMNHDVLLYGVVPDHPEPLAITYPTDTLAEPLRMGYVEPALPFWTKLREWVELTDKTLRNCRLTTDTLTACTKRLHRYVVLLEDAANRQLNNERLPDETCRFMAHIGDSIQQFTLSMIEPEIDRWDWAAGTDRSVAVFEKANQRNAPENPSNEVLYTAIGDVNSLYVVVEIDGRLYLTKGATFSYHEFFMPKGRELKEEDWQEMRRRLRSY